MVTKDQFFDQIADLQFYLQQSVENLNDGGCGLFCREMSLALEKLNIPYEIVVFDDREDYNEEIESVQKWNRGIQEDSIYYSSPSHICLRVFNKLFDGYDSHWRITQEWSYNARCYEYRYTLDELITIVNHAEWNKKFDRENETVIKNLISDFILVPFINI